ncbi:MAG: hypothetical protein PVI78_10295 [Anaerolineales bacterium]|jgi:hypothetical protein
MFFGLSLINAWTGAEYVQDLGVSWLSLQPHLLWMAIESEPGVYDWSALDREVRQLQSLGLDITMVLSPAINAFGEQRDELIEIASSYSSVMHFLREGDAGGMVLYPHGDTMPIWLDFVRAAVDRYDGDGQNDMPGLRYQARNWHFIEEYPIPEIEDPVIYVDLLKATYEAIKSENPNAKVILAGLAGNFAQYFAFMDGYIEDPDAGVIQGVQIPRDVFAQLPVWSALKADWEYVLEHGAGYFDIVDLHAYITKETFLEGEIEYLRHTMQSFGYTRPIWIIEGGGPFKNYPGKRAENTPADPYYGLGSLKENAEFVIKLHALSAAMGVERQHWGLGLELGPDSYWDGPWCGMSLMDGEDRFKRPSYYTFKLMVELLDGFTQVDDLSRGETRIISFTVDNQELFVIWNASEDPIEMDLSTVIGFGDYEITHIVTTLEADLEPIYLPNEVMDSTAMDISLTPIFAQALP